MANNPRPLPPFMRGRGRGVRPVGDRHVPNVIHGPSGNGSGQAPEPVDQPHDEASSSGITSNNPSTGEDVPLDSDEPFRPQLFLPSRADVHETHAILVHIPFGANKEDRLPVELADLVLHFANYYPVIHNNRNVTLRVATTARRHNKAALLYLVTDPIPYADKSKEELLKVRSVDFQIRSCDQGWGGQANHHGTYNGSFTWFDACILRPVTTPSSASTSTPSYPPPPPLAHSTIGTDAILEDPLDMNPSLRDFGWEIASIPKPTNDISQTPDTDPAAASDAEREKQQFWLVQRNVCAQRDPTRHTVQWYLNESTSRDVTDDDGTVHRHGNGDGEGFVGALRKGDRIGIWARALYPGWVCDVRSVDVAIEYSI